MVKILNLEQIPYNGMRNRRMTMSASRSSELRVGEMNLEDMQGESSGACNQEQKLVPETNETCTKSSSSIFRFMRSCVASRFKSSTTKKLKQSEQNCKENQTGESVFNIIATNSTKRARSCGYIERMVSLRPGKLKTQKQRRNRLGKCESEPLQNYKITEKVIPPKPVVKKVNRIAKTCNFVYFSIFQKRKGRKQSSQVIQTEPSHNAPIIKSSCNLHNLKGNSVSWASKLVVFKQSSSDSYYETSISDNTISSIETLSKDSSVCSASHRTETAIKDTTKLSVGMHHEKSKTVVSVSEKETISKISNSVKNIIETKDETKLTYYRETSETKVATLKKVTSSRSSSCILNKDQSNYKIEDITDISIDKISETKVNSLKDRSLRKNSLGWSGRNVKMDIYSITQVGPKKSWFGKNFWKKGKKDEAEDGTEASKPSNRNYENVKRNVSARTILPPGAKQPPNIPSTLGLYTQDSTTRPGSAKEVSARGASSARQYSKELKIPKPRTYKRRTRSEASDISGQSWIPKSELHLKRKPEDVEDSTTCVRPGLRSCGFYGSPCAPTPPKYKYYEYRDEEQESLSETSKLDLLDESSKLEEDSHGEASLKTSASSLSTVISKMKSRSSRRLSSEQGRSDAHDEISKKQADSVSSRPVASSLHPDQSGMKSGSRKQVPIEKRMFEEGTSKVKDGSAREVSPRANLSHVRGERSRIRSSDQKEIPTKIPHPEVYGSRGKLKAESDWEGSLTSSASYLHDESKRTKSRGRQGIPSKEYKPDDASRLEDERSGIKSRRKEIPTEKQKSEVRESRTIAKSERARQLSPKSSASGLQDGRSKMKNRDQEEISKEKHKCKPYSCRGKKKVDGAREVSPKLSASRLQQERSKMKSRDEKEIPIEQHKSEVYDVKGKVKADKARKVSPISSASRLEDERSRKRSRSRKEIPTEKDKSQVPDGKSKLTSDRTREISPRSSASSIRGERSKIKSRDHKEISKEKYKSKVSDGRGKARADKARDISPKPSGSHIQHERSKMKTPDEKQFLTEKYKSEVHDSKDKPSTDEKKSRSQDERSKMKSRKEVSSKKRKYEAEGEEPSVKTDSVREVSPRSNVSHLHRDRSRRSSDRKKDVSSDKYKSEKQGEANKVDADSIPPVPSELSVSHWYGSSSLIDTSVEGRRPSVRDDRSKMAARRGRVVSSRLSASRKRRVVSSEKPGRKAEKKDSVSGIKGYCGLCKKGKTAKSADVKKSKPRKFSLREESGTLKSQKVKEIPSETYASSLHKLGSNLRSHSAEGVLSKKSRSHVYSEKSKVKTESVRKVSSKSSVPHLQPEGSRIKSRSRKDVQSEKDTVKQVPSRLSATDLHPDRSRMKSRSQKDKEKASTVRKVSSKASASHLHPDTSRMRSRSRKDPSVDKDKAATVREVSSRPSVSHLHPDTSRMRSRSRKDLSMDKDKVESVKEVSSKTRSDLNKKKEKIKRDDLGDLRYDGSRQSSRSQKEVISEKQRSKIDAEKRKMRPDGLEEISSKTSASDVRRCGYLRKCRDRKKLPPEKHKYSTDSDRRKIKPGRSNKLSPSASDVHYDESRRKSRDRKELSEDEYIIDEYGERKKIKGDIVDKISSRKSPSDLRHDRSKKRSRSRKEIASHEGRSDVYDDRKPMRDVSSRTSLYDESQDERKKKGLGRKAVPPDEQKSHGVGAKSRKKSRDRQKVASEKQMSYVDGEGASTKYDGIEEVSSKISTSDLRRDGSIRKGDGKKAIPSEKQGSDLYGKKDKVKSGVIDEVPTKENMFGSYGDGKDKTSIGKVSSKISSFASADDKVKGSIGSESFSRASQRSSGTTKSLYDIPPALRKVTCSLEDKLRYRYNIIVPPAPPAPSPPTSIETMDDLADGDMQGSMKTGDMLKRKGRKDMEGTKPKSDMYKYKAGKGKESIKVVDDVLKYKTIKMVRGSGNKLLTSSQVLQIKSSDQIPRTTEVISSLESLPSLEDDEILPIAGLRRRSKPSKKRPVKPSSRPKVSKEGLFDTISEQDEKSLPEEESEQSKVSMASFSDKGEVTYDTSEMPSTSEYSRSSVSAYDDTTTLTPEIIITPPPVTQFVNKAVQTAKENILLPDVIQNERNVFDAIEELLNQIYQQICNHPFRKCICKISHTPNRHGLLNTANIGKGYQTALYAIRKNMADDEENMIPTKLGEAQKMMSMSTDKLKLEIRTDEDGDWYTDQVGNLEMTISEKENTKAHFDKDFVEKLTNTDGVQLKCISCHCVLISTHDEGFEAYTQTSKLYLQKDSQISIDKTSVETQTSSVAIQTIPEPVTSNKPSEFIQKIPDTSSVASQKEADLVPSEKSSAEVQTILEKCLEPLEKETELVSLEKSSSELQSILEVVPSEKSAKIQPEPLEKSSTLIQKTPELKRHAIIHIYKKVSNTEQLPEDDPRNFVVKIRFHPSDSDTRSEEIEMKAESCLNQAHMKGKLPMIKGPCPRNASCPLHSQDLSQTQRLNKCCRCDRKRASPLMSAFLFKRLKSTTKEDIPSSQSSGKCSFVDLTSMSRGHMKKVKVCIPKRNTGSQVLIKHNVMLQCPEMMNEKSQTKKTCIKCVCPTMAPTLPEGQKTCCS